MISQSLAAILACPRCRGAIEVQSQRCHCRNPRCALSAEPFPVAVEQPVLVDFENSLFARDYYEGYREPVMDRDENRHGARGRLRAFLLGTNKVAATCAPIFLRAVCAAMPAARPRVLVVGGGRIGSGAEQLYQDERIELIGTDVYPTENTALVADGHSLPFRDGSFDGVWIQAVLEHVLEPAAVVAEISRVLKPGGLAFADTPFIQQVHEQAYDFTRFTLSGHRWLFRDFEEIWSGASAGPGTALIWSIRYLARSWGAGQGLALAASLPFFWLRFFDRPGGAGAQADGASGVFFLGRKTSQPLRPRDLIAYYRTHRASLQEAPLRST